MDTYDGVDVKKTLKALARIKYAEKNIGILSAPEFIIVSNIIGPSPLSYGEYCGLRKRLPDVVSYLLTATLFSKLPKTFDSAISSHSLIRYIYDAMILKSCFRRLCIFDGTGDGYIRQHELEIYIYEALMSVPQLAQLQENFYPFYVFTAVRRFFFFLDPNRTDKIHIRTLVSSRIFAEWMRILPPGHPDLGPCGYDLRLPNEGQPLETILDLNTSSLFFSESDLKDSLSSQVRNILVNLLYIPPNESNWFSPANASRVYTQYLQLDTDQNGMLSAAELQGIYSGFFTPLCIRRIFEECHTYNDEVDYRTYLDIVLACENRSSHSSIRFFFRLLDIHQRGYITQEEIHFFYDDVCGKLLKLGNEIVNGDNVSDEIFDMVSPKKYGRISLQDLYKCKVGGIVCGMLTNSLSFLMYDGREETKVSGGAGNTLSTKNGEEWGDMIANTIPVGSELAGGYAVGGIDGDMV